MLPEPSAVNSTVCDAKNPPSMPPSLIRSNPPGDIISSFTLAELSNLSFNLSGWTISNLHYVADSGSTLCGSNNTSWCNPEGNTGNLYIKADFTKVPEPITLSLFSAGLVGAAALRRRRKPAQA